MALELVEAFALKAAAQSALKVSVAFDDDNFKKPLSVFFSNPDDFNSVSVPWEVWQMVVEAVASASDQ